MTTKKKKNNKNKKLNKQEKRLKRQLKKRPKPVKKKLKNNKKLLNVRKQILVVLLILLILLIKVIFILVTKEQLSETVIQKSTMYLVKQATIWIQLMPFTLTVNKTQLMLVIERPKDNET